MLKKSLLALLALSLLVLGLWLFRAGGGRPVAGSELSILFSGETFGELDPCNCSPGMSGGLPVRGGYLLRRQGEYLLLDLGCVGNGARAFEILRAQAALRAMEKMGYDAVNVGETELWLGQSDLGKITNRGVPFVSANVVRDDGKPAVLPYRVVERAGLRVAITGVVAKDRYEAGAGLKVSAPREALARLLPALQEQAGAIIVLADLDKMGVAELADEFPEISAILFRGRGDSQPPTLVNRTVTASVYGETLFLGDLTLVWGEKGAVSGSGGAVMMSAKIEPDASIQSLAIEWYKAATQKQSFDLQEKRPGWQRIRARAAEQGNRYVGSLACRTCHPVQYEKWAHAGHAHAMSTLEKAGYERSPECVVCHVVGYAAEDGFSAMDKTAHLGNVGCEACHGRGGRHLGAPAETKMSSRGEATCRECHTSKAHPSFNFEKHYPKIEHLNPKHVSPGE